MEDIRTEADIALWMNRFYKELLEDEITAPVFEGIKLDNHLPHIINFWAFVLLDKEGYRTNVFQKHVHLDLQKIHFERWLFHFRAITDELFSGEKADIAKQRVGVLATTFYHKLHGVYEAF